MMILGIYPKQDPVFQAYHIRQFIIARNRLSQFSETNNLLNNFSEYGSLRWKESRNKIFLLSTIRPHRPFFTREFLLSSGLDVETVDRLEVFPLQDLNEDPNYPETLMIFEKGLSNLVLNSWNPSSIREFKNRISSYDYYVSDAAFSEIYIASLLAEKLGYENITLSPSLQSGKNGDIKVSLNDKEIYLELTSTANSLAEIKIQKIFDDFAKFLGTLNTEKSYDISIWVNTSRLPLDKDGNIDEEESKSLLKKWADILFFNLLIDCTLTVPLETQYFTQENEILLSQIAQSQHEFDPFFNEILSDDNNLLWARNIRIDYLNSCPFERIACHSNASETSIHVDGNSSFPSEVGLFEEKSFFNKIFRSITNKISHHQFESGHPAIIVLKTNFWANWFEEDDSDFQKIKQVIDLAFSDSTAISGILIYKNDFRDGRFIKNDRCDSSIVLTDQELSLLFSK